MKAIFLILVAIPGLVVETTKIRATRTSWIQYTPTIQNTAVPIPTQLFNQYYDPNIQIPKNGKLIYSYVDPRGTHFNMYGYGTNKLAGFEAYKAYMKSQNSNGGQISQSGDQVQPGFAVNSIYVQQSGLNGHGKANADQIAQSGYQTGTGFATNGISIAQSGLQGHEKTNGAQIDQGGYQTGTGFAVNGISIAQSGLHGQENNNGDQSYQNGHPIWPGFAVTGIYGEQSSLNGYERPNADQIDQNGYQTGTGFALNGIIAQSGLHGQEKNNGDQSNQNEHPIWPDFAVNGIYGEQSSLNGYEKADADIADQIDQNGYQIRPGFTVNDIYVKQRGVLGHEKTNGDQSGYQSGTGFAVNGISIGQSGLHGHQKTNVDQSNQNEHPIWPGLAVNGFSVEQSGLNGYEKANADHSGYQIRPGSTVNGISIEHSSLNGYGKVNGDQISQSEHQTKPSSIMNGIFTDQNGLNGYGGLISHSENQHLQNSAVEIPLVHQNLLNYGQENDLNLHIDRIEQNSDDSGKNVYSIHHTVQNPDQINFSVDQNDQTGENEDQVSLFVDKSNDILNDFGTGIVINGEHSPKYSGSNHDFTLSNIENVYSAGQNKLLDVAITEENNPLYSGTDDDVTLSNIAHIHSADQSKILGIANGASSQNNGNEINMHNEQNTSTVNVLKENDLISGDDGEVQKAPDNDLKEIVIEVSIVPDNDLTSQDDEGILTDIEDDHKVTGTENEENAISENHLFSAADEGTYSVDVDRNRLAENDASLHFSKEIITNPENSISFKHTTVNDLIHPTPYSDLYSIHRNYLNNIEKKYRINTMPHVYPYILQQNQMNRYKMPWSADYSIRDEQRHTYPVIEPVPESISPKLVKNLVSSICLNPQVNVIPGNEEDTSAEKRLDTLLKILKIFGIHHIPRNIDKNIKTSQDIDELERSPSDFDYTEGVLEPFYYDNFLVSHVPLETDSNPLNPFPSQHHGHVQKPYVKPDKLNILSESLTSNEPHPNYIGNIESKYPEYKHTPGHDFETVHQNTSDSLQTINYNEANIMMAGYNTPGQKNQLVVETTPEEKFILLLIEAIKPELVRFYYSQCHSGKDEKLVEGIKALINSLQGEHCEIVTPN